MIEEPSPYSFNSAALEKLISTARFDFGGEEYEFGILDPEAFPTVKYFTGMKDGNNLMISSEVPDNLREYWLRHEILCNRLRAGETGRCANIEKWLIETAPPAIGSCLLETRCRLFQDLVIFYKIDLKNPENDFYREIAGTYKYLRGEVRKDAE